MAGEAAALSLRAGVDMDFAGCSYSHLAEEVKAGRVNISDLDRAVSNVLRVKFATGLFDRAANVTMRSAEELDTPTFRRVRPNILVSASRRFRATVLKLCAVFWSVLC
eukprot:SAG11_NODE_4830_length_1751_cov_2.190073_2_plen_108_part_00